MKIYPSRTAVRRHTQNKPNSQSVVQTIINANGERRYGGGHQNQNKGREYAAHR